MIMIPLDKYVQILPTTIPYTNLQKNPSRCNTREEKNKFIEESLSTKNKKSSKLSLPLRYILMKENWYKERTERRRKEDKCKSSAFKMRNKWANTEK